MGRERRKEKGKKKRSPCSVAIRASRPTRTNLQRCFWGSPLHAAPDKDFAGSSDPVPTRRVHMRVRTRRKSHSVACIRTCMHTNMHIHTYMHEPMQRWQPLGVWLNPRTEYMECVFMPVPPLLPSRCLLLIHPLPPFLTKKRIMGDGVEWVSHRQ